MLRRAFKCLSLAILFWGTAVKAYAVAPGFYLGLMGGPVTNNAKNQQAQEAPITVNGVLVRNPNTVTAKPRSTQFGSRAFMGYQVSPYAGFEAGITYISGINYNTGNVQTCSGVESRVRDFDLVGKGSFPFYNFDVYGKAGVALTYVTTSGAISGVSKQANSLCGSTQYQTKFNATGSIGASYAINQSWLVDASWNRIMVGGTIGSIDFYALGFSYHFVDRYCGQFLCDD